MRWDCLVKYVTDFWRMVSTGKACGFQQYDLSHGVVAKDNDEEKDFVL